VVEFGGAKGQSQFAAPPTALRSLSASVPLLAAGCPSGAH